MLIVTQSLDMRVLILCPVRLFKSSSALSGGLGVVFGFLVTFTLLSRHEESEEIIPVGDLQDGTNSSTVSKNTSTLRTDGHVIGGRVFCMVISDFRQKARRAINVNNTWGKRCDKLLFFTSRRSHDLDTVLIPESLPDTEETLWERVTFGFSYAYSYYHDFDWFLKADDDTYVVMENLKVFLSGYNPKEGLYFGCRFFRNRDGTAWSFMSGGAGYVLSKEALRLFVEVALPRPHSLTWAEDVNMALCLESVDVRSVDTRDYLGRPRFNPLVPRLLGHLRPKVRHDFWYYSQYRIEDGPNCCAESAITFHYAVQPFMDLIEFFIYHLSPYQH